MRRSVPVLIATAGGAALLAAFHTTATPTGVVTGAGVSTTAPAATEPPTSTSSRPTATTGRSSTTSTRATVTTTAASRTVTGPVVDTRYGPVEVRVTLRGTRIADVQALELPSSHARSQQISSEAAPLLRDEALQAQSARIDLISGASYTSEGYAQSLQGALDRAGL